MLTSATSTSVFSRARISIAAAPLEQVRHSNPACSRTPALSCAASGSSSTIRTAVLSAVSPALGVSGAAVFDGSEELMLAERFGEIGVAARRKRAISDVRGGVSGSRYDRDLFEARLGANPSR